jgi:hypothetical protein
MLSTSLWFAYTLKDSGLSVQDNEKKFHQVSRASAIHDRIQDRLAQAGPRKNLALDLGVTDGQLSKLINGELLRVSQLLAALGLSVHEDDYVGHLRALLREEMSR